MGSSTRKIQKKIKEILSKNREPIEDVLPKVIAETIRMKKVKNYFGDKDFENLVTAGIAGVSSLCSGTFNKDYNLGYEVQLEQIKKEDTIKVEQIIESILDKVEDESQEIENSLILSSFKVTMAEIILDNSISSETFLKKFMNNLLYSLIMENINEAVIEVYDDINSNNFKDKVREFSNNIIAVHMSKPIYDYINKNIELEHLIEKIIQLNENIKELKVG